ncbi:MAG: peptide deformylase [Bacteroidales bacterium]|nr:peptide deformylase [Bacteroidales bacterium]
MILPITAFGHPILKKRAEDVSKDEPNLKEFVDNMFETMLHASGVGLAAPQVNKSLRIFVVDTQLSIEGEDKSTAFKQAFINPEILDYDGEEEFYNEGCLSVPDIHEDVARPSKVLIRYFDMEGTKHEEWFDGFPARVIQHEYDHLEGKTFVDHLTNLRKIVLKRRLNDISKGAVRTDYKMIFPSQKKNFR